MQNWFKGSRSFRFSTFLKNPHIWIVLLLFIFLLILYLMWPWREWNFPPNILKLKYVSWLSWLYNLAVFETQHRLIGSLFYIPIVYSIIVFHWHVSLVITFFSIFTVIQILFGYRHTFEAWFANILALLSPSLISSLFALESQLRKKDREMLIEKEKERNLYQAKVNEALEKDRKYISQEIHDDTIQTLLALASYADALEFSNNIAEIKDKITWIKNIIRNTAQNLRIICLHLRPAILDELGLISALKWLAEQVKKESKIETEIIANCQDEQISKEVQICVFRVVQEALNNVKKHAHASSAKVSIKIINKTLNLDIYDNGIGFIVPESLFSLAIENKLGLIGIQERVQGLNGKFKIASECGKGTKLSIEIPL